MNKIYRIIWNSALNAWVVVSELTRNHTKRASATVATAVLATLLSATVQASTTGSEADPTLFDPNKPNSVEEAHVEDTYRFGLAVLDEKGEIKDNKLKNKEFKNDEEKTKYTISVEDTQSGSELPMYSSSFLYLKENGGIELEQNGRLAKFKVKTGDGLKIDETNDNKLVADTINLTVTNGKVGDINNGDNKKLVNAGNLATTLNGLGWQLKTTNGTATAGTNTTSTVKSGDEVEFKGEGGVTVTSSTTDGKHTVTIKAAPSTSKGGAWKITAGQEGTGEIDPANNAEEATVSANDKVTLKAGDNLKIKQNGKDFTYSLKKDLKNLTSVEFKDANGKSSATTKIDKDGLTITPATVAGTTGTATPISVTKDGISAGNKAITNVASGLTKYNGNGANKDLVNLTDSATGTGGTTVANTTAATVGDLRGLGWVLSAEKTTDDDNAGAFHAAVKNANEVEFKGKGSATVSAKSDSGKYVVTVDVAETQVGDGLEKDNGKIKLKVDDTNTNNVLTVSDKGASVTKGTLEVVGASANGDKKGQVKAKGADGNSATDTDKSVATVKSVADAINSVSTFVKAESTTDDIEDTAANGTNDTEEALKAGDTLTFKAGKNLKVKHNGKSITFDLAKNLEAKTATFSDRLTIGGNTDAGGTATPKVDITSTSHGLNFAKNGAMGDDANVYLNGIASTLTDTLLNGGAATNLDGKGIKDDEKKRAASVKDVLNAGWNVRGVKPTSTDNTVENINFVATYDTVEFVSKDNDTTSVTVENKENGKKTEVKIGAKTSVIKEKDGKLVTGKELKTADNAAAITEEEGKDEGKGLVTAKTVIEAVNKAGWRVKTTADGQAEKFETVTSGTNVTFADGKGTTATVTKDDPKGITVTYNANVGDGLKLNADNKKIVADTVTLTVNGADGDATKPKGKVADVTDGDKNKLVSAGGLVEALNKLSWTAKADKEDGGEADNKKDMDGKEVKAGEVVTFKAGKNLKVKQDGANFTYSLKDSLTGLTSITLGDTANGGNGATTKITSDGLTITPAANAGATGANDANKISVTKDGIKAGNQQITNVASALKTYKDTRNAQPQPADNTVDKAKEGLVNLDTPVTPAAGVMNGAGADTKVPDTTAATVGDLRGLGWVLSSDKTTKENNGGVDKDKAFHAAVKNANEVEFVGTGSATVSAKTEGNKHVVTVDVAETKVGSGLKKDADGTIKLNTKTGDDNLLKVNTDGTVEVTKGGFADVDTAVTAAGQGANNNRGKVVVKASDTTANGGQPSEDDKKKAATVGDVAKAINDAATFVKAEDTNDEISDTDAAGNGQDEALKAGDTLTLKAGKNLKVKRDGKNITFALANDLNVKTATVSDKLSIGKDANKVDVTSTADGLTFAKEKGTSVAGGTTDTKVHLNNIASTLDDHRVGGNTTHLDKEVENTHRNRAATVGDVLNSGWNIQGNGNNVDYVATYDTVNFTDDNKGTTTVTVTRKDNGKGADVKIGAKTSVIAEKDGKLVTGKDNKEAGGANANEADNADEGKGLVTAETVIKAVNEAGWRVKTTANGQADNFETVKSGTNVTFDNGSGTTAEVTKNNTDGSITVKYNANVGDGLKIGDDQKITADTTTLTVNNGNETDKPKGKVAAVTGDNKNKLVKADDLVTALNSLSWTATAGKDGTGEEEGKSEQEVKAGDKVTFNAGNNLKVKQSGKDFTYSLKDKLSDLTSITLGKDNETKTVIDQNGLTITPATVAGTTGTATPISVTKDGISAGNKEITNVKSGLSKYTNGNDAKNQLVDLSSVTTPTVGGATTTDNGLKNKAATVGDLAGLGWVLSAKKTTDGTGATDTEFHAAVKNANEVEFVGTGSATVSAKTTDGKHVVTVNVKETELGDGLEKDNDGKIKLKVDSTNTDNVLTVDPTKGASVVKGSFADVDTAATAAGQATNTNRGKVTVSGVANGTPTDADKKKVATVVDVAKAINDAATFVKVGSTTDDIEDDAVNGDDTKDEALKAGDTLTLKAGKNLKVKRDGKEVTFALAKDLDVKTATVSEKLSIGSTGKVDVTSDAQGLHFAKSAAVNGDKSVHLNGIASTLTDTLLNAGTTKTVTKDSVTTEEKQRAASVQDVLNAGWNIRGATTAGGNVEDVDFVRTYDKVEFVTGNKETLDVVLTTKDNNKTTEVKFTPKTSVISEKDGKLVTGKANKAEGGTNANPTDDADEGKGLVTANTVIDAVNKAGWRVKTTANGQAGNFETVKSGTNVTFENGQGTTATVSKGNNGDITVKYDAKVGDGLKVDNAKGIVADTTKLTVNDGTDTNKPKGKVADVDAANQNKLVKAGDLATALNKLSWTATAGKDGTGEVDPENPTEQEVKAGDKVTFKAGNNLKVKQSGKDFTYSLKESLTGLKDITLNKASDGTTNGATTKITNDGLTITPATGANNANISVTTSGISAGDKAITNVKSGLNAYGDTNNPNFNTTANSATDLERQLDATGAYTGLLNLNEKGANKQPLVADSTAATVGDLRKLGWVLSSKNGTTDEKSQQVKQADEVLFTGAGAATVSSSSKDGKHTITVSVAETKANSGLEKDSDTIKLKVDKNTNNVLTVSDSGTAVTKGEFNTVDTSVPAENATTETKANRGKVTVNGVTDLTKATETDKKKVATVIDVATAINSAATFVKTENLTTALDEDNPTDDGSDDALKAGDTLTFKAGKNLKVKRSGKEITFDLAKNLEAKTATFSDKLSIGSGANKVDVTSDAKGLNFAKAVAGANNDTTLHLNGIASTLQDTLAGTQTTKVEKEANTITDEEKHRAASVQDVFNAGWNIKGFKPNETTSSNVDFVRTYDTVEFVSGNTATTDVTVEAKDGGKRTVVTITAKNDVGSITTTEGGKVVVGTDGQANTDTGARDKVAKTGDVVDAINKSGFTLKTSATAADDNLTADALKNKGELINPGKTVEMVAGKNLTVKQEADGKVTYAIKDDVEFATVKIGKDEDGKKPVSLMTEKAAAASNNEKEPETALKISSEDDKPTQLVGVASVLNTSEVSTKPDGDKKADGTQAESKTEKLIDLTGTDKVPVKKNAAATVGDLQNMGWVVSTKDGNGYTDVVKNAGKVDFKGGNGIEVRGSTAADGTRVITVSAKGGKVTNKVEITKTDGSKVDAVIVDGKYYERDENGKPKMDTEISAKDIKAADNSGSGFVTGNTVANAINDSGWNVGLADGKKAEAAFADGGKALSADKLEKVNPDDNLRFADGKNTKVKAATVDEVNKDGRKITNTYVKFDVELPIGQIENVSRDAEGNAVKKVGDKWYPADQVDKDGTLKNPATALSDEEAEKVVTGNVAAIDPEKGGKYKSANQVEKGLTAEQMGELAGKQAVAAEAAKLKIGNLLKNQPKDVIDAASDAAVKAAQDEAKAQYLKEKGLDKGMGGTVISNLGRGTAPGDAVNVDQLQNSGWYLDAKVVAGSSGKVISGNVSPSKVKMDETVNIDAGNNIEITRNGKNIGIATSMTPQFSSVSLGSGADAPTLSVDNEGALKVGSKDANKPVRITNVAPGVKDSDVANVAQLKGSLQNLNNRIDNVDGNARAGIAQAIATAGLAQAYLPGKSMMAIGGGTYRGEAGYAIGYSSISDTGNWVIKGTASGNSRGHFGASTSVGYQW